MSLLFVAVVIGLLLLLALGLVIGERVDSGQYVSIAERDDASRSAEAASRKTEQEPPAEYCPPSNPDWFDEWWREVQQYFAESRAAARNSATNNDCSDYGSPYGDLPGHTPRNPPPPSGRPPRRSPRLAPPPADAADAWADNELEKVVIRMNKDG